MVMLIAWGSLFNKGKGHFIYEKKDMFLLSSLSLK